MTTLTEIIMDNICRKTGYESTSEYEFTYSITLETYQVVKEKKNR